MPRSQRRPEDALPLPTQVYHVLLALGNETLHGYGMIRRFEELSEGRQTLLPGSLYATLARMVELGMVEPAHAPRGEASSGPERRYYRVTAYGRAVARAETERLEWLVGVARRGGGGAASGGRT